MSDLSTGIVAAARGWIGTPYRHQASVRGHGADCLGLLRGVWREILGPEPVNVPAYTPDWSEPEREERLWSAARTYLLPVAATVIDAGDVLLFRMKSCGVAKHLGILAETGASPSFIHAYSGHGVTESALTASWRRRVVAHFRFPVGGSA